MIHVGPRVLKVNEKIFEESLPPERNGWKIVYAHPQEAHTEEKKGGFLSRLRKIFG